MSKSKYPYRVVSVEVCGTTKVAYIVSANGTQLALTPDDIICLNWQSRCIAGITTAFQLSDLMGVDIRALAAIRAMRLELRGAGSVMPQEGDM